MAKEAKSVKSGIEAYNVKLKRKEEITDVVIDKNEKRYFAKGISPETGGVCCVAMGEAAATAAIKEKRATKGKGWD